jgi:hypothetical protein
MFRAFALAFVAVYCLACGEPAFVEPEQQVAAAYAPYFGLWGGETSGPTSRRNIISVDVDARFWRDGDTAVLTVSCGSGTLDIRAFRQEEKAVYFSGIPAECPVHTTCGDTTGRLGGIVMIPVSTEQMAVQVTVEVKDCSAARSEVIMMSGILARSAESLTPLEVDVEADAIDRVAE